MKQRKTIAVLSLLLAGSICFSACGGEVAEPSSGTAVEDLSSSAQTSDTTSAAELSDEQREALDDWIWYERGDYTSENWYHIASDGTVEMHTEYGSTEDTYTAYPMLGCSYNFEGFDVGPDDVPFLSLHMEENVSRAHRQSHGNAKRRLDGVVVYGRQVRHRTGKVRYENRIYRRFHYGGLRIARASRRRLER